METAKQIIAWTQAHWQQIVMVGGAAYTLIDLIIRLAVPSATAEAWEARAAGAKGMVGRVYLFLESVFTFSRFGKK